MCLTHWRDVPDNVKHTVMQHYRPGAQPTPEYDRARDQAIASVASKEGVER